MNIYDILKIVIVMALFYYIKTLDIPDSYKFLLTIVPSLLLISTSYVIRSIQFAGRNKPLTLKRKDNVSDKPLIDEYFFEAFTATPTSFVVEMPADATATLYEQEKPFWIQEAHSSGVNGYFDIANPRNYVALSNLHLDNNYTLEFWLRLDHQSNNGLVSFVINNNEEDDEDALLTISYDKQFLYVNNTTKIPLTNKWFHLVVMRGTADTLGTNRGYLYINGILHTYIRNLPNLQQATQTFLFKHLDDVTKSRRYNKKYHDLANVALVRFYNRSLTMDEIQNNFLKDAHAFDLQEENMAATRTYVQGSNLMLYIDARQKDTTTINNNNNNNNDNNNNTSTFNNKNNNNKGNYLEIIYNENNKNITTESNNKNSKTTSVLLQPPPLQKNWLEEPAVNEENTKVNNKQPLMTQNQKKSPQKKGNNNNDVKTSKPIF